MKMKLITFSLFVVFLVGCTQIDEQNIKENNLKVNDMKVEKQYEDVTSEKLKQMLDSGEDLFLVDVHIPEQQHIKGTDAFMPYNEIENNLDSLPDKNAKIVLYCKSGSMSREAAQKLADLGYKNVLNHLGGTIDWKNKGFEFE